VDIDDDALPEGISPEALLQLRLIALVQPKPFSGDAPEEVLLAASSSIDA
jgi:hypothetical protein